jgi:hypothetical protein
MQGQIVTHYRVLEPRFVFELAKLLERSDDRAGAREQYQRFLELWKGADPGLPELDQARRLLQQLRERAR